METIILILVLAPLAAFALVAISLPFIKHNNMKAANDWWEEPAAPDSDTKAG